MTDYYLSIVTGEHQIGQNNFFKILKILKFYDVKGRERGAEISTWGVISLKLLKQKSGNQTKGQKKKDYIIRLCLINFALFGGYGGRSVYLGMQKKQKYLKVVRRLTVVIS